MTSAIIPTGTDGFPLWALLLSILVTGGGGAALWNLVAARMSQRAVRDVTASTANLNDVAALNNAITGLAGENQRLAKRLSDIEGTVEVLKAELSRRPTKDELRANVEALHDYIEGLRSYIDQLQTQLTKAGITPVLESPPAIPAPILADDRLDPVPNPSPLAT